MRTYGNTDSAVLVNTSTGLPMPGVQLLVWDAETGGTQVTTGLLATDGTTPLPGYVVSGVDGSFGHKEAGTADARWYSTAAAPSRRWYAEAHEALSSKATPADVDAKISAERAVSVATFAPLDTPEALDIATDVARVATKFVGPGAGVSLGRSGTTYSLRRGIGNGRYSRYDLVSIASAPGGYALNQLKDVNVEVSAASKAYTDAAVTYVGTWTAGTNASAYGGGYKWSKTWGDSATFTTPTGVTSVGIHAVDLSNAGLAKVEIDGDATRAKLLPTAQQMIDQGTYTTAILVSGGGVLQPTDRVIEGRQTSAGSLDAPTVFADDLAPGVHTVAIKPTGYFHAANYLGLPTSNSTDSRVYVSGFLYSSGSYADAGASLIPMANLNETGSAWEYALATLPAGATNLIFLGNIHGYDVQDSLTFAVDGTTVTPADGSITWASQSVRITRTSHLLHPDTGATKVADCVVVYTMDRRGLRTDVTITFATGGYVASAYSMMPLNGSVKTGAGKVAFTRGSLTAWAGGAITFPGTSDTYYGNSKSAAAWVWDGRAGGVYAAAMWQPDALGFSNKWADSGTFLNNIEDRPAAPFTKVYFSKTASVNKPISAGLVWKWTTRYAVAYFPSGAETALGAF